MYSNVYDDVTDFKVWWIHQKHKNQRKGEGNSFFQMNKIHYVLSALI